METEKRLGKIESVNFGHCGYQNACLGIDFVINGDGWGVCDNKSLWDANLIKWSERCKWTEEDRSKGYDDVMRFISDLLNDAKAGSISELVGKPVEVEFEGMTLKGWRILTEVL